MKYALIITLAVLVACGRPSSTEQQTNELQERKRQESLSEQYQDVVGTYSGVLILEDNQEEYAIKLELKIVDDVDSSTGLPLNPKIVGSFLVYEISGEDKPLLSYGVSEGSYDPNSLKLVLSLSNNLRIEGLADQNTFNGELTSQLRGKVGRMKLVWGQ